MRIAPKFVSKLLIIFLFLGKKVVLSAEAALIWISSKTLTRPVKTGVCGGGGGGGAPPQPPQVFAKIDLLPIDNDSEKKVVKKI